jgi:hypothetical protein
MIDDSNLDWSSTVANIAGLGLDYWSTKKNNELVRQTQWYNAREAEKQRAWASGEAQKQRAFNSSEALYGRQFAAGETRLNRKFQQDMSSSAVQRRMADMKKAGINPILAGKFDASSPAGNVAAASTATGGVPSGAAGQASAAGVKKMEKLGIQQMIADLYTRKKQGKLTDAQADKVKKETEFVGNKTDITSPFAELAAMLLSIMKQWELDRNSAGDGRYSPAKIKTFIEWLKERPKKKLTEDEAQKMLKQFKSPSYYTGR